MLLILKLLNMISLEWLANIGASMMLLVYLLGLGKKLSVDSLYYSGFMCIGAGILCYYSFVIGAYPILVVEGIWSLSSLIAFIGDLINKFKKIKS